MPPKPQSSKATPRRKPAAQTNRQRSGLTDYVFFLSPFLRVIPLIAVAATASYVSQLSLAPVYGDIPSALYHDRIVVGIFVSAWLLRLSIWSLGISTARPTAIIPVLVLYTPAILHHVFRYSARFGAVNGPVITEAVTFYPVLFLSVYAATGTKRQHGLFSITYAAVISFVFYHLVSVYLVKRYLPSHIGSSWVLTRCGLTHAVGGAYAALSPSLLLLAAIPALYHSATTNPMCVFTPALNATLAPWNHTIIARQESITGYVSVVENFDAGYRVLRCDHSLLGGEWLRPPAGFEHLGGFKEPIYAVFVIMEAVRLVEPAPQNPDPKALAIGLGIGTSADALIRHGIETDIVELDPVVYRYAKEYFGLAENHTVYIEDALVFIARELAKDSQQKRYDYILHDVFTGGAVPAALFTQEVFLGLRTLMSDDGVIAINWAGDLKLRAARTIIDTVRGVFGNCRVFREEMQSEADKALGMDFTNMVIFCTKPGRSGYRFRAPLEADFLGSYARQRHLFPKFEIKLEDLDVGGEGETVLVESNVGLLEAWQKVSAVGHWGIIRTVVPAAVWENY